MTTEEKVVQLLMEMEMTVSTAESCTGGLVAATLVNVAGVSAVFNEGYITYANEAKHRLLGVSEETLSRYGAVSSQAAEEMAKGVCAVSNSDCSVVTTGIAGPDGGTPEKPVGLVYIGCAVCGKVSVHECRFSGDRSQVRNSAAKAALEILEEQLQGMVS